jgi:hypothetical protein
MADELVGRHLEALQGPRAFDVHATATIFVKRARGYGMPLEELLDWIWAVGPEITIYDWTRGVN